MENQKKLSFMSLLIAVFTSVVGAGIYFKFPAMIASTKGNLSAVILAWLIGGAIVLSIGLVFAEIFSDEKTAKGGFVKLGESIFGRKFGFAITWSSFIFYLSLLTGLVAHICITFLFAALKIQGNMLILGSTILLLVVLFIANFLSLKFSKVTNAVIVLIKLIPLLAVIVSGVIFKGDFKELSSAFAASTQKSGSTFALASASLPAIMFSLEGWLFPAALAADAKDPKVQWPIAFISGIVLAVVVYLLFTLGTGNLLNINKWSDSDQKMANVSQVLSNAFHSDFMGKLLFYILSISLLGTTNALSQSTGRMAATLADDNMFPKVFSKRNNAQLTMNSAMLGLCTTILWVFIGASLVYLVPSVFAELKPGQKFDAVTQDYTTGLDTISNWTVVLFFAYYCVVIGAYFAKRNESLEEKGFKLPSVLFYVLAIMAMLGSVFAIYSAITADNIVYIFVFGLLFFSGFIFHSLFDKGEQSSTDEENSYEKKIEENLNN